MRTDCNPIPPTKEFLLQLIRACQQAETEATKNGDANTPRITITTASVRGLVAAARKEAL